jgi:hypothetical protein
VASCALAPATAKRSPSRGSEHASPGGLLRTWLPLGVLQQVAPLSALLFAHNDRPTGAVAFRSTAHRDPIEGGGGEVREFSLPPPWPCLPVLRCRSTRPGRRLSTSPRRGETPRFGGRTPAVPASLPTRETPVPDALRGRLSRYQRWGVARGSRGDGGEVSPTPPHACFSPLTSPHTRRDPASADCRHRPKPGNPAAHAPGGSPPSEPHLPRSTTDSDRQTW